MKFLHLAMMHASDGAMQKRVLIIGGEGSLAKACAEDFSGNAWEVLAPSRTELDISEASSVEAYFAECGEIDLLICAAGVTQDEVMLRMKEADWDKVLEVNLSGAFRCARAVSRQMLRRRSGHVLFVSSYSAIHPPVGQVNYAAAKAGLIGMAKSLAAEWGDRSVRVNVLIPGFMDTKMTTDVASAARDAAKAKHVLEEFNTPDRVAKFAYFLDEHMELTSGQVFNLDSRIL